MPALRAVFSVMSSRDEMRGINRSPIHDVVEVGTHARSNEESRKGSNGRFQVGAGARRPSRRARRDVLLHREHRCVIPSSGGMGIPE